MTEYSRQERWALVRGTNLKPEDRHILLTLFLIQGDNGAAYCRQETLSEEIGVHPRSIRRSLQRLNAAGIVRSDWQVRNSIPMRHYAIDFDQLKTVQRPNGRTPASYRETPDGRTPASATVGHQRPKPQDTSVLQEVSIEHPLKIQRARTHETAFQKPTAADVAAYAAELTYTGFDADHFVDHYTANGWTQGKGKPIKCWKAAVRNWRRRDAEFRPAASSRTKGQSAHGELWRQVVKACLNVRTEDAGYLDGLRAKFGDRGNRVVAAIRKLGGVNAIKGAAEAAAKGKDFGLSGLEKRFGQEMEGNAA